MSLPMVKEAGVPDREDMRPGMAFFAGAGPAGKTCGDCKFRGYYRQSSRGHWNEAQQKEVYNNYRVSKCAQFKRMAARHGPDVDSDNPCCKYFEAKPK